MPPSSARVGPRGPYCTAHKGAELVRDAELHDSYNWASCFLVPARSSEGVLNSIASIEGSVKALTRTQREDFNRWVKQHQAADLPSLKRQNKRQTRIVKLKINFQSRSEHQSTALDTASEAILYLPPPEAAQARHISASVPKSPLKQLYARQHSLPAQNHSSTHFDRQIITEITHESSSSISNIVPESSFDAGRFSAAVSTVTFYNNDTMDQIYEDWTNAPEFARPGYISPYPDDGVEGCLRGDY